jgi:hypothetical protein
MPRTLRRKKRKKHPLLLKERRGPVPLEVKRYFAMKKCKVPSHIISARQPMETEVRLHVKINVPWDQAAGIFGKHMQSHLCLKDKRIRYGANVWVGSLLAVIKESPGIREFISSLGIKPTYSYLRDPKGDHIFFIKLPGAFACDQVPEAKDLLAMVQETMPKSISYFIGPKYPRRVYRLQECGTANEITLYPLLNVRAKRERILRPASEQDIGEVVAMYKTFVRHHHLLDRTITVSDDDIEALETHIPKKLHLLPAEAIHHLIKLRNALIESRKEELRMAVGW